MVTYAPRTGGPGVRLSVRLHSRIVRTGDLDREGFSQTYEDVERIVFLALDAKQHNIERQGVVTTAEGQRYRLEIMEPPRDAYTVEWQVVRLPA